MLLRPGGALAYQRRGAIYAPKRQCPPRATVEFSFDSIKPRDNLIQPLVLAPRCNPDRGPQNDHNGDTIKLVEPKVHSLYSTAVSVRTALWRRLNRHKSGNSPK